MFDCLCDVCTCTRRFIYWHPKWVRSHIFLSLHFDYGNIFPRYKWHSQIIQKFHNEYLHDNGHLFISFLYFGPMDSMIQLKKKISYSQIELRTRFNLSAIRILCLWSNWCTKLRLRSDVRGEMGTTEAAAAALAAVICGKIRERDRERLLALGRGAADCGCLCMIVKRSFNDNTVDPFKWTLPIDDIFSLSFFFRNTRIPLCLLWINENYNLFVHLHYLVVAVIYSELLTFFRFKDGATSVIKCGELLILALVCFFTPLRFGCLLWISINCTCVCATREEKSNIHLNKIELNWIEFVRFILS